MFHLNMLKRGAATSVSEYFERWCAGRGSSASAYYMGAEGSSPRAVWRTFGAGDMGVADGAGVRIEDLTRMLRGQDGCGYFLVDPSSAQLEAVGATHAQVRTFRSERAAGASVEAAGGVCGLTAEQSGQLDLALRGLRVNTGESLAVLGMSVQRAVEMLEMTESLDEHASQVKAVDAKIVAAEKAGKTSRRAELLESRSNLLARQKRERAKVVAALRAGFEELADPKWSETLDFFALTGTWLKKGRVADSALGRVMSSRRVPTQSTVVDGTFSAPKSVSVLAGLLDEAGREKVIELHSKAVMTAMAALIEQVARTRTGRGGSVEHLVDAARAAEIIQIDSRTGAIHLHSHMLLDLAALSGDRVGALSQQALFDASKNIGRVYQQTLRYELSRAFPGIEWTQVSANGLADIANIPDHVLQAFSERTFGILLSTLEAGRIKKDEPEQWDILVRVSENYVYFEGLRIRAERLGEAGLTLSERQELADLAEFDRLVEVLEESMTPGENRLLTRLTRPEKNSDFAEEAAVLAKFDRDLASIFGAEHAQQVRAEVVAGLFTEARDALEEREQVRADLPNIVARGIDEVAAEYGSINPAMVFAWVVEHTPGGAVSGDEVIAEVDRTFERLVAEEKVLLIRESKRDLGWLANNRKGKGDQYTTREVISLEFAVDEWAVRMADRTPRAMTRAEFLAMDADLDATPLNVQQRAFAEAVCSAAHGLVVVEAPAGTGKSFALGSCRPTLVRQGRFVVGLAPMNVAAAALRDSADAAMSVDMFLTLTENGADITRFAGMGTSAEESDLLAAHRTEIAGVTDPAARQVLARRHERELADARKATAARRKEQVTAFWDGMAAAMDDKTAKGLRAAMAARKDALGAAVRKGDYTRVPTVHTSIGEDGTVAAMVGSETFRGKASAEQGQRLGLLRDRYGIGVRAGDARDTKVTVVVDEAGMLGTDKFARLAGACDTLDVEQVVLMGDSKQLSAVRSASGLFTRISQKSSETREGVQFQLQEVARARAGWEKDAQIVMHDAAGELTADKARDLARLYAEQGRLTTVESSKEATKAALDWYKQARNGEGEQRRTALMIASTNAAADKLNAAYLSEAATNSRRLDKLTVLEERGELSKRQAAELERRLSAGLDYIDTSESYLVKRDWGKVELRRGERVSFRTNDLRKGISNKDLAVVEAIDNRAGTVSVRLESTGRVVLLDREAKAWGETPESRVRHGYASTVHSAQGATVDEAMLVVTEGQALSAELVYVAMSRGRDHNGVIAVGSADWDAQDFLAESMLHRDTSQSVLDLMEQVAADGDGADSAARRLVAERLKGHGTDWTDARGTPGGTENARRADAAEAQRAAQEQERSRQMAMGMEMSYSR